ncbi:uncharacterized protein I206_105105 [Kwoniella pini CBS 10737]|uniref:Uncharacterized protein n=1 Tax=Kwoniella pini CBS 10737 TaxID=1296096 RepID=A0A1B9I8T7_9TREE|nr:uncharacterized protein I206_02646 [Kwoniella pini CBS 10737]OCF51930.1 hypothetical protein I206_02646 [Kwoniella pini CBS 10737]
MSDVSNDTTWDHNDDTHKEAVIEYLVKDIKCDRSVATGIVTRMRTNWPSEIPQTVGGAKRFCFSVAGGKKYETPGATGSSTASAGTQTSDTSTQNTGTQTK